MYKYLLTFFATGVVVALAAPSIKNLHGDAASSGAKVAKLSSQTIGVGGSGTRSAFGIKFENGVATTAALGSTDDMKKQGWTGSLNAAWTAGSPNVVATTSASYEALPGSAYVGASALVPARNTKVANANSAEVSKERYDALTGD